MLNTFWISKLLGISPICWTIPKDYGSNSTDNIRIICKWLDSRSFLTFHHKTVISRDQTDGWNCISLNGSTTITKITSNILYWNLKERHDWNKNNHKNKNKNNNNIINNLINCITRRVISRFYKFKANFNIRHPTLYYILHQVVGRGPVHNPKRLFNLVYHSVCANMVDKQRNLESMTFNTLL